jgi:hypothetical protein
MDGLASEVVSSILAETLKEHPMNPRADALKMLNPAKAAEELEMVRALMFSQSNLAKSRNEEAARRRVLEKAGEFPDCSLNVP